MKKYEYKYQVPRELLPKLRMLIQPFVKIDSYMNEGGPSGYTVRSIYFDSSRYDYFHEKEDGLKVRKKIRIRGYNTYSPENTVFLEIKRKNEKQIFKNRAPVTFRNLKRLMTTCDSEKYVIALDGLKNAVSDSKRFLFHVLKNGLHPLVLVVYNREAFFGKYDRSLRITFDKNLRSSIRPELENLFTEEHIKYSLTNKFILEVKFIDVFPSWMKLIIKSLGLQLQSTSKYTICIDEHNAVDNKTFQPLLSFTRTMHY